MSHTIKPGVKEALLNVLSAEQILEDQDSVSHYGSDWALKGQAGLVLKPKTTADVSAILKICDQYEQEIVPSAGRTGLAGGATCQSHQIAMTCELMANHEPVDPIARTVIVQPGVITESLQEIAKNSGLYFAIDLSAKGSSQIGGNIASNVGGMKFIRYGGMREQILGLEVVLADGTVLNLNRQLFKDNTGYDLKQLFIGSEGTLGFITKACIKLWPSPPPLRVGCLRLSALSSVPSVVQGMNQLGLDIYAAEYFDSACLNLVRSVNTDVRVPFEGIDAEGKEHYLLIEVDDRSEKLETFLMDCYEKEMIKDVVLDNSSDDKRELWRLRELVSESISVKCLVRKNDVSLPIGNLVEFLESLEAHLQSQSAEFQPAGIDVLCFGHIGDGNLHINYTAPRDSDSVMFKTLIDELENQVLDLVRKHDGSISAEHGIGLLKKKQLADRSDSSEMNQMMAIKNQFDPKNILNPGKIFDMVT
ncbi:MAG: FAD-binding oxidoreductase [Pseudobacteriovorax sp.]|nr:FAD-binding oxidoreductase [Pseudobacteriovorax sp.]